MAETSGLLNRRRASKLYRGFESLSLRQFSVFDPTNSLLGAGVARWFVPNVFVDKILGFANVRFTMTTTDLDGNPLSLTNSVGNSPAGLAGDLGSVLKVEASAYRANFLMEASFGLSGWTPVNSFYNSLPSNFPASGTQSQLNGGFWQDTIPTIKGTPLDDNIVINANTGIIRVNGNTRAYTGWPGFTDSTGVIVDAGQGNDAITYIPGPKFAADGVTSRGGDSDASSETLVYAADTDASTTIDLETGSISSPGTATAVLTGIEHLNEVSSGAGSSLTVAGGSGDDEIDVQPTSAGAGTIS